MRLQGGKCRLWAVGHLGKKCRSIVRHWRELRRTSGLATGLRGASAQGPVLTLLTPVRDGWQTCQHAVFEASTHLPIVRHFPKILHLVDRRLPAVFALMGLLQ